MHTTDTTDTTTRRSIAAPGRSRRRIGASIALVVLGLAVALPTNAARADADGAGRGPSSAPTASAARLASKLSISEMVREAKPLRVSDPTHGRGRASAPAKTAAQHGPDGPTVSVTGTLAPGSATAAGPAPTDAGRLGRATTQNGLWTGSATTNPNRQVGKLYFDTLPGTAVRWSHCSATVITAANKSTVVTAGHCVFNPDPDNDGVIQGNGRWYEHIQFCPGYENGCKLGRWHYRRAATTNTWFYGLNRRYNYSDDVALVVLNKDSSGRYIQNVTGSQGILFNKATGLYRRAFGYPAADSRWPQYLYNGEDLVYAAGYDSYDSSIPGTMWMNSTMTGGASGGPWLISPNASWLGYVNSVNSHKPYGGAWMSGPYFGNAEAQLYSNWQAA